MPDSQDRTPIGRRLSAANYPLLAAAFLVIVGVGVLFFIGKMYSTSPITFASIGKAAVGVVLYSTAMIGITVIITWALDTRP